MAGIKGLLSDPLLSVVMPVYNERETIEGMIARVLAVRGIRIELIVVDDGSKDGTSDIVRDLQKKYTFKLLQKPNGGKGSALRMGFKEVTGDKPKMWGTGIVGFGSRMIKYADGRELDWPVSAFAPRKGNITFYVLNSSPDQPKLLEKLGKHKASGGCLHIKRLSDVNEKVLADLIKASVKTVLKAAKKS